MTKTSLCYTHTLPHTPCEGENASQGKVAVSASVEQKTITPPMAVDGGNGTSVLICTTGKNPDPGKFSGTKRTPRPPRPRPDRPTSAAPPDGTGICATGAGDDDAEFVFALTSVRPGSPLANRVRLLLKRMGRQHGLKVSFPAPKSTLRISEPKVNAINTDK